MGNLRYLTAGESHGPGLTVIVEGLPLGVPLGVRDINPDLSRRQGGYGRGGRMKIERDQAVIRSGMYASARRWAAPSPCSSKTATGRTGARRWRSRHGPVDVPPVTKPRPGHADLAGMIKYGTGDLRNILERSSARETTARVAVGAVARKFLAELGIRIRSRTARIGPIIDEPGLDHARPEAWPWDAVEASPVRAVTPELADAMMAEIDAARTEGSTLGGVFEVVAWGAPVGLGSHVHWDRKLDARLTQAIVSINAVKGAEIGPAFANAAARGHDVHDEIAIDPDRGWARLSNRAGGFEGGMTNGQPIVVRGALKPISTMRRPLRTVDVATLEPTTAHFERSDVCVVPAAGVIGEAMTALVLADAILDKFGGDSLPETRDNLDRFRQSYAVRPPSE